MKLLALGLLVAAMAQTHALPVRDGDGAAEILTFARQADPETHNFHYAFTTSNGITREETGEYYTTLDEDGEETLALRVIGSYSWIAPDGVTYTTNYIADDKGYRSDDDLAAKSVKSAVSGANRGAVNRGSKVRGAVRGTARAVESEEALETAEAVPLVQPIDVRFGKSALKKVKGRVEAEVTTEVVATTEADDYDDEEEDDEEATTTTTKAPKKKGKKKKGGKA